MFLVSFGKNVLFLRSGLFLPFFVVIGLQKPFYIALTVDNLSFYLNVWDNACISPFLQCADAYFQAFGCISVA